MKIMTPDEFTEIRNDEKEDYFYELCSDEKNSLQIKKFFLMEKTKKFFDKKLITVGLLGAINHNQEKIIDNLLKFAETYKIIFSKYEYEPLFNCATKNMNLNMINYLEDRFNIIRQSLNKEGLLEVLKDGRYFLGGAAVDGDMGQNREISKFTKETQNFYKNPFRFNTFIANEKAIKFMLEKNENKINPTLVEEVFVESCVDGRRDSLLLLIANESTRDIIKKSEILNAFLNENTQFLEIKKEAKIALSMINLNESLNSKSENNFGSKRKI